MKKIDPDSAVTATLDHERLDVYRTAIEFHAAALACVPRKGAASLRDQLERASASVILNIAEGAGRTARTDKRRFYEMAKEARPSARPSSMFSGSPGTDHRPPSLTHAG